MLRVLKAEFLKLKRARALLWTVVVVLAFAGMTAWGAEIWDPNGGATWANIMAGGPMYMAGWWGTLIFSMAAAHLFGTEFSDRTAAAMFTTPVRREYFLAAKFVVLAAWAVLLALVSVGAQAGIAIVEQAHGFEWQIVAETLGHSLMIAFLLYFTMPLVALVAMLGRGYVAPMLFASAAMTASWAAGFLGWAEWFPWSMPATVAGGLGPPTSLITDLGFGSWLILGCLFVGGMMAVFAYVDRAVEGI